jgi:hypothetical protein
VQHRRAVGALMLLLLLLLVRVLVRRELQVLRLARR